MGTGIPSVRDAAQPSNGSDGEMLPPLPYPFGCSEPASPTPYMLPLLLIYRATSKGSAGVDGTPRGAPPAFSVDEGGRPSRRWGVDLREDGGSTFVRGAKGRERGETAASFPHRAPVPAQRHRRSGATRTASRTECKLRRAAKGYANASPSRFARPAQTFAERSPNPAHPVWNSFSTFS